MTTLRQLGGAVGTAVLIASMTDHRARLAGGAGAGETAAQADGPHHFQRGGVLGIITVLDGSEPAVRDRTEARAAAQELPRPTLLCVCPPPLPSCAG